MHSRLLTNISNHLKGSVATELSQALAKRNANANASKSSTHFLGMTEERRNVAVHPVVLLGIPTHFRLSNEDVSACGIECPEYSAYDGRDIDCARCRKTKAWKRYMGQNDQEQESTR